MIEHGLLTAAELEEAALLIDGEVVQIHGTAGLDGHPTSGSQTNGAMVKLGMRILPGGPGAYLFWKSLSWLL